MLIEILKQNGVDLDKNVYFGLIPTYLGAKEHACREYIEDNGFDVEWLPLIKSYGSMTWICLDNYLDYIREIGSTKEQKLVAWLFSRDIKINEERGK